MPATVEIIARNTTSRLTVIVRSVLHITLMNAQPTKSAIGNHAVFGCDCRSLGVMTIATPKTSMTANAT